METAGNRVWSRARGSMGGYRTELPGTDPLQGSSRLTSPPHPSPHSHTPCNCRHPRFCQASHSRVFFRRSRLFFREAAFFSGGEGCEWGAKQPTVGKSGIKLKMSFQLYPTRRPTKGLQPSHLRLPTFCSFPYHNAHIPTSPHPHIPTKSLIHPPG